MSETEQKTAETEAKTEDVAEAKAEAKETTAAPAEEAQEQAPKKEPLFPAIENKDKLSKRSLRAIARRRRKVRIQKEPDFAKALFGSKSQSSLARKKAFKTRHAKK